MHVMMCIIPLQLHLFIFLRLCLLSFPQSLGVLEFHSYYACYSESQQIWLFMSYIYKFLLQIAAIYFAFTSRKIRVKALNDSKEVAAIIYITSLLLVISAFGFWIGLVYLNTSTAVFGLAQLLTATVILGLLFIPKVRDLHMQNTHVCAWVNYTEKSIQCHFKCTDGVIFGIIITLSMQMVSLKLDPDGKNVFSSTLTQSSNQTSINVTETESKLQEMTMRVKELESELKELKSYQVKFK